MYVEFIVLGEKTIIQRDRPVAQYNIRNDALREGFPIYRQNFIGVTLNGLDISGQLPRNTKSPVR